MTDYLFDFCLFIVSSIGNKATKLKVLVKLFQKLAVSKGRAFGRSKERNGGAGAAAPALQSFQKSFCQTFPKKFERTEFAEQGQ